MTESIEPQVSAPADQSWQQQLRDAVRDNRELEQMLELPAGALSGPAGAKTPFPLLVPRSFVARMRKGDPHDPLLRQVLPTANENLFSNGYTGDPLREHALAHQGCIHKYPGRVLLVTTAACPVHCRYCFRREFPYSLQTAARENWRGAIEAIQRTPGAREVILSGGDPLSLDNDKIAGLIRQLEPLARIETLRIHTRFPIVLPDRVDRGLIEILQGTRFKVVVVVHANHPNELDIAASAAMKKLHGKVNALLNQSVLLRSINDSVDVLVRLSESLLACGVTPYYLHLLDRVTGTAHFEVSEAEARDLIVAMRRQSAGYLVPRLVRDVPGELSKTPIS